MRREASVYEVELLAFGGGAIRRVNVPTSEIPQHAIDTYGVEVALEAVFRYGQNEVQPLRLPSVSVGDVIRYGSDRYLVEPIGFRLLDREPVRCEVCYRRAKFSVAGRKLCGPCASDETPFPEPLDA